MKNSPSKTFSNLSDFISNKMRMAHIYQPVMLIELLRNGGDASVTEIAKSLLGYDISQVEYYEQITKNMVGKVLTTNNGITEKIKYGKKVTGFRIPNAKELSEAEIEDLISLCTDKIEDYIGKRGDVIWTHRKKSSGYIPGTLRYEILKRAKYRCELCGISAEQKALEIDHIIPRNKGGTDDKSNLQSLCYSCNATKRDLDDTDFRGIAESYNERKQGCLFCEIDEGRVIASNELCYAIRDYYPVTEHHTLIIPKRHVSDFFELHQPEINAVHSLLDEMRTEIEELDENVTGFNVGINSGEDAGQTVMHCHIHLIPRRKGDMENPRGGVRGVIPDKRIY
jgi:ATP adenylyltransferase